jgi:hypothetical protein
MTPRQCMINVIADIVGLDETYTNDRLNDPQIWDRFMQAVFKRMDTIEDETVRGILNSIDTEDFQQWIDDPDFWEQINEEVRRRLNVMKTLLPSKHQGYC